MDQTERLKKVIVFPVYVDKRGYLSVAEFGKIIPFVIKRVFWIWGVPKDEKRGGHYHESCSQVIICIHGNLTVQIEEQRFLLRNQSTGILVSPGENVILSDFSEGAVCLVLCSEIYEAEDVHIRDASTLHEFIPEWVSSS